MDDRKGVIITVDGPAGGGKSTVARLLAARMGLPYLDTGAMYRAVALQARRRGVEPEDGKGLEKLCRELDLCFETRAGTQRLFVSDEDISLAIRSPEMDLLSSRISAVREVRDAMTALQRKMGGQGGLVAEGRDMGTVVFPGAHHKFFITASPAVRVERRYLERAGRGEAVTREEVERELRKRDDQDMGRSIAPLVPAEDAILVDTTDRNADQVVETLLGSIRGKKEMKKS